MTAFSFKFEGNRIPEEMSKHLLTALFMLGTITLMAQKNFDSQIDSLLQKMTLEEKVGQMNQYNGFYDVTGPAPTGGSAALKYEHLKKGWVGAMLSVRGVEEVHKLQKMVVEESRLGIPLLFGFDVIHGYKTLSPIPLAEAASWDMEAIRKSASVAADEASAVGLNWTFAPMVDISRDARWGRVMEGGGEDPYLGSQIARARVRGFQGNDLGAPNTIAATAKHFAAYGFVEGGIEYGLVDIGTHTLYNQVLPPFRAAVEADVKSVMNGFNILNGVPVTGNSFLMRDLLKGKMSFGGFVVSDWASAQEMVAHGFAKDDKDAALKASTAGSDMEMESATYVTHLSQLVREGKVDESVIDEAVRRILRVKFELGLFEDPFRYCDPKREKKRLYHKDHQAAVRDMARKSFVLLKNEGELLPLGKDQKNILVVGALAEDKNSPLGSWRIASDDDTAVSIWEGLRNQNKHLTYVKGPQYFDPDVAFVQEVKVNEDDFTGMKEAVEAAKIADVVVLVAGEHGFQSGEGRSRSQLGLPGIQPAFIRALHQANPNIVLLLLNGRPLVLPWEAEHIPAILECWQPGTQAGHAVADVVFGDYNPAGKLPMTFPRNVGQVPIYYNHANGSRPEPQPIVFWSHYIDSEKSPLFPFGYGLSYTQFSYSDLKVDSSDPNAIQVSATLTNTGKRAGEEVAQLYIRDLVANQVRPIKELKGFKKVHLEPGASVPLRFTLTEKELGYYNQQYEWTLEPGDFEVMIGGNSEELLREVFTLN